LEILKIDGADDIPNIHLDPDNMIFRISGVSTPENAFDLYSKVIRWLENNGPELSDPLECTFDFKYLSSSSHKMVFDILNKLEMLKDQGKEIQVKWYFKEIDEDMMELGEDFSELIKIPFELIPRS